MRREIIFIIIFLFYYFLPIKKIFAAVDIKLYQIPSIISLEPFTLIATISGARAGTNYLRIDLFKEGTNSYFGETFNGRYWYSGSNYQEYLPATISGALWTGEITGRVNRNDIAAGFYKIRLRRYTSSGSYSYSPDYDIYINFPTPTLSVDLNIDNNSSSSDTIFTDEFFYPTNSSILNQHSYENIYLSEVYPNPLKGESEWVEIYNDNDFSVELINWYLDDIEDGGSSPKKFSLNLAAKSYGIIELSSAMFNNDGDSVRLLDFNKNLKDSFEYSLSQSVKSYGRISFETDEFCLQEPSKGAKNNNCLILITVKETPLTQNIATIASFPSNNLTEVSITKKLSPTQRVMIFNETKDNLSFNSNNSQKEVLGKATERVKKVFNPKELIKGLSFLSLSYSSLAAIGIFLKIK